MRKFVLVGLLLALAVSALFVLSRKSATDIPVAVAPMDPAPIPPAAEPVATSSEPEEAPPSSLIQVVAPAAEPKITVEDAGSLRSYAIALDEVVRRDIHGQERAVPLPPQGTLASLRKTWSALPRAEGETVFPVAYEEGVTRTPARRRLISAEIRVEMAPGATLPAEIPDSVRVQRFDYAPQFAVLHMTDSFSALDRLQLVRALPQIRRADVLLARQQSRKSLPSDSLINNQWHLKNTGQSGGVAGTDVNVEPVWNYPGTGIRGAKITVGIVDDGLQLNHPDLAANVRTDIDHDWNDGTVDDPSPGTDDDHGTSCAGNVAAVGNNSLGVAGSAPEAKVVGLRLIAAETTDMQEADAMNWEKAAIHIKSNSWGPEDDGQTLEAPGPLTKAALKDAAETGRDGLGTVIMWAAGNGLLAKDNSNYDGYANSIYTMAVGAIANTRVQAEYSESGANLVVTAPSSGGTLDITTVDRTGAQGYNTSSGAAGNYASDFGGTSSATPTAAGVVALLLQSKPTLGRRDVQEILMKSALQVNPSDTDWVTNSAGFHFNHKFGAGLIDAQAAVALGANWTNLAAETSTPPAQSNSSVAIPNNSTTGITRTFDLSGTNLRVEHVTVRVNITHTARGNLAITLTSPSNVASRLAEVHNDSGDNYSDWTFSTVRNWGENSRGTWTLKIADLSGTGNSTGGTLTAAELIVYGTNAVATNPAPTVQLTAPQNQSTTSIGTPLTLTATASDLTTEGAAGVISKVDFLSGTTVIGSASSAPYSFTWTPPAAGTYTLSAKAVDSEGAVGTSSSVTITVANQPPVVNSAAVTPAPQAFSDQPLSVAANATDPEGAAVTLSYQWQSSPDGVTFTNVAGQTGSTVQAASGNAGKVWRCLVTPSDGANTGAGFTSNTAMVLTRPAGSVTAGAAYSYTSDLVLRGTATTFTRAAIINEFSQGPSGGTAEWVELLTLQAGSFRNWKFDDAATDASVVTFANSAVWDNVPAGTRIVIYNGASKDAKLPADDFDSSDGSLIIGSNNTTYFTGSWPSLANGGDALILTNAGGTVVHQIGYGTNPTVPDVGDIGSTMAAAFTGDTEAAATTGDAWRPNSSITDGSASVAGVTPGQGNTTANIAFANNLRSGFFSQPALFRFGANAQVPEGLSLSSSGVLGGTVTAAAGSYQIVIERYNGLGETASLTYTLTVVSTTQTYSAWLTGYPDLADTSPTADPDKDGRSNLLEYFQALDPTRAESGGADILSSERRGTDLLLHYRKSKTATGLAERVVSSEDLRTWSAEGITFDADVDRGTYLLRTARQPIGASSRLFLQLILEQMP